MNKMNKRLLPFRQYDEADVINEYALNGTGEYGLFVKVSRGDTNDIEGIIGDSFAASFDGVTSPRWGVKNKVSPITSGDSKYDVLGLTLYNVMTHDENGMPLDFYRQKGVELYAVPSGCAVPVIGKGRFTLGKDAFTVAGASPLPASGTMPSIGSVVVPSNFEAGKVDIVPQSSLSNTPSGSAQYGYDQVIGKVIATGIEFGGSVYITLDV